MRQFILMVTESGSAIFAEASEIGYDLVKSDELDVKALKSNWQEFSKLMTIDEVLEKIKEII